MFIVVLGLVVVGQSLVVVGTVGLCLVVMEGSELAWLEGFELRGLVLEAVGTPTPTPTTLQKM